VEAGEKFATALLAHVIVPAGESPTTFAVQVVAEPILSGEGEQRTLAVATTFATESEELPELGGLLGSPP
jgi:hypothetical protein